LITLGWDVPIKGFLVCGTIEINLKENTSVPRKKGVSKILIKKIY
jgi:hypothetical protein